MQIKLYFFGKNQDRTGLEAEYIKRLNFRVNFEVVALLPSGKKEALVAKREEADRILSRITDEALVIAFDERGKSYDSVSFSQWFCGLKEANRPVVLIIGGAAGLDQRVRDRANFIVSFGGLVWTKDVFRLMCLEQCYRAFEIAAGSKFHKV